MRVRERLAFMAPVPIVPRVIVITFLIPAMEVSHAVQTHVAARKTPEHRLSGAHDRFRFRQ
jgi:hypothetical protein